MKQFSIHYLVPTTHQLKFKFVDGAVRVETSKLTPFLILPTDKTLSVGVVEVTNILALSVDSIVSIVTFVVPAGIVQLPIEAERVADPEAV